MKLILHLSLLYTLFAFTALSSLYAQDCSILAPGSDAGFDQLGFCAPVTGRVKYFTFYTIHEVPSEKLKAEINWGEKKIRYDVEPKGYDDNLKMWVYQMPTATYEYAANRQSPKCSYPVSVQAVVNGVVCGTPKQSGTVMVWDKDDANGGSIVLAPTTYYACPGTEFSVNFTDKSSWNCAPPKNGNWPKRTTQFLYGSTNTITGSVKVGEEVVPDFPFPGALQEYPEKAQGPSAPFNKSASITIPATAKPGERFEITLNNWNYCNPYPEAPVQKIAIIEIVAKPQGRITIKNGLNEEVPEAAFCPNEEIRLLGNYFVEEGEVDPADVRYDWEIQDLNSEEVLTYENQQNLILKNGFPRPGRQRILLKVSNKKTNTVLCQNVTEKTLELIDAPSVLTHLNDSPVQELNFCAETSDNIAILINYRYTLSSNEDFSYTYHLYKRNSTKSSPDSILLRSSSGLEGIEKSDTFSILYSQPGLYRLQTVAKNNRTGCRTIEESRILIYENPLPAFTTEGQCAGQAVEFKDLSRASAVPGDKITSWEWDMNYSQENEANNTFEVEKSGKDPFFHTFAEAGNHRVALRVTNAAGCSSLFINSLHLNELPASKLSSNYIGGLICPGDTVRFFNQSPALNNQHLFPEGIRYTLNISDSIVTRSFPFSEEHAFMDYSSFFNPSDSVETYTVWLQAQANNPNFCAVKSDPIQVKVRSGASAGYKTLPTYSPFEPNCSPNHLLFVTNEATQALKADGYKWTIMLNGQVQEEIRRERGGEAPFDTLEYTFKNNQLRYLDYVVILSVEKEGLCIIPAINTYRIYPNPLARFSARPVLEACDSTVFDIKVNLPLGISDYSWGFSELPANEAEIGEKDDHFYVSYKRPAYGQKADTVQISLKARNFYGCTAEWTEQVVIQPVVMHTPQLLLEAREGNGCSPQQVTFTNLTVGDSARASFEFYIENIASGTLQKIPEAELEGSLYSRFGYTFRQSGNYNVYLKGIAQLEGGECIRPLSAPVAIEVLPDPTPAFKVLPAEDCGSLQAFITKTGHNSDFDTWQISKVETGEVIYGPARFAAANDTLHHYLFENHTNQAIRYRLIRMAESLGGCTASDSAEVVVHPLPQAHFQITASLCEPYVVEVAHQTADNADGTRYTWHWGDGTRSEGANPPPHTYYNNSYTRPLHYNVRLVAETSSGCLADSTIRLVVQPKVKADFEADVLTGCAPMHVNFTNKSSGASEKHSGWYIREKGEKAFAFAGHSLLFHAFENQSDRLKTYEVMYKAQKAGGCADSVLKEINVRPEVLADFHLKSGDEIYSGQPVGFTNQHIIPGVSYSWNWGDGSAPQETAAQEVAHTYTNYTTSKHYYEVSLTAHDSRSDCKSISRKMITVYPALQLSLIPKKEKVCLPELPEFSLEIKNVTSAYWYVGIKGKVDYSRKLATIYDASLFPNSTGRPVTYSVTYVGVSEQGVKDSIQTEVQVYPALAPSFTLDGLDKRLPQATFKINNTTPNAAAFASHWSFGDGQESSKTQPDSHTYKHFGAFSITLTISNGFCSASYTMKVNVDDAAPKLAFGMEGTEGCAPLEVEFRNHSGFTDETKYFWDFGDGIGTSTAIHPTYTYNKPGNYKVTLHAFNRTGTESAQYTAEQLVRTYPQPRADFVVRKEQVYTPDEPVYVANYSQRANWYRWDFGDGTIYEGEEFMEPVHYYKKPGVYDIKLLVRSPHGCMDSLTIQRAVTAIGGGSIQLPNAFTPSLAGPNGGRIEGAGQNDVFHPHIKGGVVSYHLQIFNRWGELVFETKDKGIGWDGYYKGQLCPSDVYIYNFSAVLSDGKRTLKKGDVLLIR